MTASRRRGGLLSRAFTQLRVRMPDARLVMVGVRQGGAAVRARIWELGLDGSVRLVPPVSPSTPRPGRCAPPLRIYAPSNGNGANE